MRHQSNLISSGFSRTSCEPSASSVPELPISPRPDISPALAAMVNPARVGKGEVAPYLIAPPCWEGFRGYPAANAASPLPAVAHDSLAGVGARDVGELTLEGGGGGPAVQPLLLGRCGDERGVTGLRCAVDHEG